MATITETLTNRALASYSGGITFTPTSEVGIVGNDVQSAEPVSLSITSGALSTELVEGQYTVAMNGTAPFTITVPSGSGSYELHELITDTGVSLDSSETYLRASEQSLTAAQKATVQSNIDAAGANDVSGFPWIAGRGTSITASGHVAPASGTAWGMSGAVLTHTRIGFINTGNQGRLEWSGDVTDVEFYMPSTVPADAKVYIRIWRWTGERLIQVGVSEDIRSLLTIDNAVHKVALPSPIRGCQIGDHIGGEVEYVSGSWGAAFHAVACSASGDWTNQDMYWAYSPVNRDGVDWYGATKIDGKMIPIKCYMASPVFTVVGDSRGDGYPGTWSLWTPTEFYDRDSDMAARLEKYTGLPVCNRSRSGDDISEIEARSAPVIATKPTCLIILGNDYNSLYAGINQATYISKVTDIIDDALSDGVSYVVCCSSYPYHDPTTPTPGNLSIQNYTSDQWSDALKAEIQANYNDDEVLFVDVREALGQEREPTATDTTYCVDGNRYDILDIYAHSDGLHLNSAGADKLARVIAAGMRDWFRKLAVTLPS